METLPAQVAERLQTLTLADRAIAWFHMDDTLVLVGAGGDLEAYGLGEVRLGAPAPEQAVFLEGLLPLVETPYLVPSVEITQGRVADLHFWSEQSGTWLVLLEVTSERDMARRLQQKAYDMTLLQEREASLNRRLEAANAALLATQRELEASRDELARWNKTLEERVAAQVSELERTNRLKRFLAPSIAELIVSSGDENILKRHRRDIATLFCDLRGFTAFSESAEPEEVSDLLHDYHATLVPLIQSYEGTLDRFVGDGLMVFFNDPLPCPDPAERAVGLAVAMREAVAALAAALRKRGYQIGFGVGIAQGFATLGQIGFEGRFDYSAIGTVVNTAARLCDAAADGQILVTARVATAVGDLAELADIGMLQIKGLSRPLAVSNVVALKSAEHKVVWLNRQTR
ncbi:adenylate/guanylate cyclase domain-containing protein [Enhydrobacter sp.]|jgi:class 3 adenylate cyclase|uniref:adenylate/guanylate cyclase domain-containing protein n=1 Tax=Enhydrobacter sp. TaxID=1894999 RepID=UPI002603D3C7|nr:adenylate/guanylate cyclase domain-containing protein [Enhydrobacter sp.]WIM13147.1 MAG: Adenylate cyclase [Enhydrobacter sp.]